MPERRRKSGKLGAGKRRRMALQALGRFSGSDVLARPFQASALAGNISFSLMSSQIIGDAERFRCGKQVASYVGLVPTEESSGERRRLGHISKQGSTLLRFFLVEAAQVTVRSDPEWRSKYFHLAAKKEIRGARSV